MLTSEQVARLRPHYQARWLLLGIPSEKAPTRSTHLKILNSVPIQRATLGRVDKALAGRPGERPDGLWPAGTALALAEGRIADPSEMLTRHAESVSAERRETVYILGSKILSKLPSASPEQVQRIEQMFDALWRDLDERQGW